MVYMFSVYAFSDANIWIPDMLGVSESQVRIEGMK